MAGGTIRISETKIRERLGVALEDSDFAIALDLHAAFSGRLEERQFVRAMLERHAPGIFMVRGPSGVGKTALIEQVLHDLVPEAPIVGRAKCADQTSSTELRPVVDALSQAVDSVLGRLYDPASLRDLVGVQYGTLLVAGFTAAGLTEEENPTAAEALLSHEGTVHLADALVRVLPWLEVFVLPVVLFVDDCQRAPNEAVGFRSHLRPAR